MSKVKQAHKDYKNFRTDIWNAFDCLVREKSISEEEMYTHPDYLAAVAKQKAAYAIYKAVLDLAALEDNHDSK